jgi:hypothetical protein
MKLMELLEGIPKSNVGSVFIDKKMVDFNIAQLVNYLEGKKFPIKTILVIELSRFDTWDNFDNVTINKNGKYIKFNDLKKEDQEKHKKIIENSIMKTDLKYPIILLQNNNKIEAIIDGKHRTQKAKLTGVKTLPAYILSKEDLKLATQ